MAKKYSKIEIDFIVDNYPEHGSLKCATFCKRSAKTITAKALSMGIRRTVTRNLLTYDFSKPMIDCPHACYVLGHLDRCRRELTLFDQQHPQSIPYE